MNLKFKGLSKPWTLLKVQSFIVTGEDSGFDRWWNDTSFVTRQLFQYWTFKGISKERSAASLWLFCFYKWFVNRGIICIDIYQWYENVPRQIVNEKQKDSRSEERILGDTYIDIMSSIKLVIRNKILGYTYLKERTWSR